MFDENIWLGLTIQKVDDGKSTKHEQSIKLKI